MKKKQNKENVPKTIILSDPRLSGTDYIEEIASQFKLQLEENPTAKVVLDLHDINRIHSKGIAVILGLYKECLKQKRNYEVYVHTEEMDHLFKSFKLNEVMTIQKRQ